jgi:hypothetical protein
MCKIKLIAEVPLFLVLDEFDGRALALLRRCRIIQVAVETAMEVAAAPGTYFRPARHPVLRNPFSPAFMTEFQIFRSSFRWRTDNFPFLNFYYRIFCIPLSMPLSGDQAAGKKNLMTAFMQGVFEGRRPALL